MIDTILWIFIGALSGWVGYLATRNERSSHLISFILIGIAGALSGGFITRILGIVEETYSVNPDSVFSAMLAAVIFVSLYAILSFFGNTSSNKG